MTTALFFRQEVHHETSWKSASPEACSAPVICQRTTSHQKVGVIAVLCVLPTPDGAHLFFRLHPDVNVDAGRAADFLL